MPDETTHPEPRFRFARRNLLAAAVVLWIGAACWGIAVDVRSDREHAGVRTLLCAMSQLQSTATGISAALDEADRAWYDSAAPAPSLDVAFREQLVSGRVVDGSGDFAIAARASVAPLLDRFVKDHEALRTAFLGRGGDVEPLHQVRRSGRALQLELERLGSEAVDKVVGVEFAIDERSLSLWGVSAAGLFAVVLLLSLLRESSRRENAASESRARLEESEERFRRITDELPMALAVTDASGALVFANRAWRDFADGRDGSFEAWADRLHPDDATRVIAEHQRASRDLLPFELEYRIRRKDGSWRWWIDRGVARRDGAGRFLGYVSLALDITDRKEFEDHQRESQRIEAMGRLAGGIAHDLNNILTVVLGTTELLLDGSGAADDVRLNAEEIRSAAERAAQLVGQLLAFTRRQLVVPVALDLASAIDGMGGLLRRLIGEDVALTIDARRGSGSVHLDAAQLTQVVLNLAINARQAMPTGGRLSISVAATQLRERPAVELRVADSGSGMDAATLARVFEPFFTTKEDGRHSGIGLATVKAIVDGAQGTVTIESAPAQGTQVCVRFPCCELPAAAAGASAADRGRVDAAALAPTAPSARVLLVEDDDAVRPLLKRWLELAGHEVVTAHDGRDALDVARKLPTLDLLVTDVVMPGLGGRELSEEVRRLHAKVPVLFVSGYTDDDVLRRGVRADAHSFLHKPLTRVDLVVRVAEILAQRCEG